MRARAASIAVASCARAGRASAPRSLRAHVTRGAAVTRDAAVTSRRAAETSLSCPLAPRGRVRAQGILPFKVCGSKLSHSGA
jgi:hypothetical protein